MFDALGRDTVQIAMRGKRSEFAGLASAAQLELIKRGLLRLKGIPDGFGVITDDHRRHAPLQFRGERAT